MFHNPKPNSISVKCNSSQAKPRSQFRSDEILNCYHSYKLRMSSRTFLRCCLLQCTRRLLCFSLYVNEVPECDLLNENFWKLQSRSDGYFLIFFKMKFEIFSSSSILPGTEQEHTQARKRNYAMSGNFMTKL